MSDNWRFPFPGSPLPSGPLGATPVVVTPETDQIIALATAVTGATAFFNGGPPEYAWVTSWHKAQGSTEVPYDEIVIEFTASAAITIGTGTPTGMLGLYGQISTGASAGKFLLGILGVTLALAKPQIPIFNVDVGFAQKVCGVAVYDRLAIGGVGGDINTGATTVTVRARPVRRRAFGG